MIGGRIAGFRGRPWNRKSPTAIMRHTRVTTDAWLSTVGKQQGSTSMFKETMMFLGAFAATGLLLGMLIFVIGSIFS